MARSAARLSQAELAARARTSQPAVARIESGASNPTLATVERLVAAAGFSLRLDLVPVPGSDPVIERYKQDVDRTLLRANLRRSIDERLRLNEDAKVFGEALQRAVAERPPRP